MVFYSKTLYNSVSSGGKSSRYFFYNTVSINLLYFPGKHSIIIIVTVKVPSLFGWVHAYVLQNTTTLPCNLQASKSFENLRWLVKVYNTVCISVQGLDYSGDINDIVCSWKLTPHPHTWRNNLTIAEHHAGITTTYAVVC